MKLDKHYNSVGKRKMLNVISIDLKLPFIPLSSNIQKKNQLNFSKCLGNQGVIRWSVSFFFYYDALLLLMSLVKKNALMTY